MGGPGQVQERSGRPGRALLVATAKYQLEKYDVSPKRAPDEGHLKKVWGLCGVLVAASLPPLKKGGLRPGKR